MNSARAAPALTKGKNQENKRRASLHGKVTNYMDLLGSKGHEALSDNESDKKLNSEK